MDPTTAIETFLAALERDNPHIDWSKHHERLRRELSPDNVQPKLDLSRLNVYIVPPEIAALSWLQVLNLRNNELTKVPEWIGQLTQLTSLSLSNNGLTAVQEALGQLTQLQSLDLRNNQLMAVPESLGQLTQLQWLNLSANRLTVVPETLGRLTQLRELDLSVNVLTVVPESLGQLTQLRELDLSFNQLTVVPETLGQLRQLTSLSLSENQLTAVPETLGRLTQLQWLNLRANGLTVVPETLGRLTQLRELSLGKNRLTAVPEIFGQLTELLELDLSENQLTAVPETLGQLTQVTRLDLSENQLTAVPETLGQLTQVKSLDLNNNQLTALPDTMGQLTQVTRLDLSDNQLTVVPETLGQLTQLERLYLRKNALTTVPDTLGKLTHLRELYLSHNQLTKVPESLADLRQMTMLDLSFNQLTAVPDSLGQLTQLTRLDLSHNALTVVPENMGQLTRLTALDLGGNQLTAVPESLGQLTQLRELDLSHNALTVVPETVGKLTQLTALDLGGNQLTAVPEALGQLTQLRTLYLGGNQLTAVPEWVGQLTQLTTLRLRNQALTTLPETFNQLAALQLLDLRDTQIPLPPELVEDTRSPRAILDYYFRPASPLHEAKVVLVGEGGVGKTSLVRRLLDDAFTAGEAKTEGIAIRDWQPPGSPLTLHLWDFGGQELMHATHQFFLTERTLYVLVLNGRFNETHNRLDYWLKLIESVSAEAPVLVVQNYADEHTQPLDERGLRRRYPSIVGFHTTSCKTRQGIPALHAALLDEVSRLPHVNDRIPEAWFAVKAQLQAMQRDYLSFERYLDLCEAEGITYAWEQQRLIRFLHDLGTVLCFVDDPRLMETTVLNPRWVTEGIYKILNTPALQTAGGVLDCAQLTTLLDPKAYPRQTGHFLVDMLRKFELCFNLPHTNGEKVLLSDLLPVEEPELGEWAGALAFDYHYDVLPGSIIGRFIVRMHSLLDHARLWRHGAVLHDPEGSNTALVQADPEARRIRVRVGGPEGGRRRLLTLIRGEFRAIHHSFANLDVTEQVPITDKVRTAYTHLLMLERKGVPEFWPEGAEEAYSVAALLDGISNPAERRLQQQPGYDDLLVALNAINKEGWLYLDVMDLQPLQQRLQGHAAHLEKQITIAGEGKAAYALIYERDQLVKQLAAIDQLLTFKRGR